MYIYKMVYADRDEFNNEDYELLREQNIIHNTDYGTTEILADDVQNCEDKEVIRALKENVGTDVYDLLMNGGLDLVMVAYA